MRKVILLSLILIIFVSGVFFVLDRQRRTQIDLKEFYELTLKDPLFYSPFFNVNEWQEAIKGLEEEEAETKKVLIANMGGGEVDKVLILEKNNFFPYQFLENLILINQKTNEFLKNPSVELGGELLDIYDKAADSYIQDSSSTIKILNETEKVQSYYFFVDAVSSPEVTKNDFLTIKENGYKLKEEIAKRRSCLLGRGDCQALLKTKENASFFALIESLESGEFNLKEEKIEFIKSTLSQYNPSEVKGPYKIKSLCWQNPNFEHWMYLIYFEQNNKTLVLPKLANQNYYIRIIDMPASKVDTMLWEKGVNFYIQPEATTYECMDLTFYPQLLTLDFLKEKIEKSLIAKKDLEKNLDYKLLIENQFGLIAPAINTVSNNLEVFKLYSVINKSVAPLEYLFSVRTAYSIFYFPFAKSIWRIDKRLQYFVPEKEKPLMTAESELFITLDELEKLGYTKTEIKKFHVDIIDFLNTLLENQP